MGAVVLSERVEAEEDDGCTWEALAQSGQRAVKRRSQIVRQQAVDEDHSRIDRSWQCQARFGSRLDTNLTDAGEIIEKHLECVSAVVVGIEDQDISRIGRRNITPGRDAIVANADRRNSRSRRDRAHRLLSLEPDPGDNVVSRLP